MVQPPSRREILPPTLEEGEVVELRVAPDGVRLAAVVSRVGTPIPRENETLVDMPAVTGAALGGLDDEALALLEEELELPRPVPLHRVVVWEPGAAATTIVEESQNRVSALSWSPDGQWLAFVQDGDEPTGQARTVAWAAARPRRAYGHASSPRTRVSGGAYAWTPRSKSLIVADIAESVLVRRDVRSARALPLCALPDDGALGFPPRIRLASDGAKIAFSCRRGRTDVNEVYVVERAGKDVRCELVTPVPGVDAHVMPFWSPRGNTLGLSIVHVEKHKSALVLWTQMRGRGVVIHSHGLVDGAHAPVWSRALGILFWEARGVSTDERSSAPVALTRLDLGARGRGDVTRHTVAEPDAMPSGDLTLYPGRDDSLVYVDGPIVAGRGAHALTWSHPVPEPRRPGAEALAQHGQAFDSVRFAT